MPGRLNAIDHDVLHAWHRRNGDLNFARGDVLRLPPEGVADPVDKIDITVSVFLQEIAGSKPNVALRKDITKDLLFRLLFVIVPVKPLPGFLPFILWA